MIGKLVLIGKEGDRALFEMGQRDQPIGNAVQRRQYSPNDTRQTGRGRSRSGRRVAHDVPRSSNVPRSFGSEGGQPIARPRPINAARLPVRSKAASSASAASAAT